ncbi:MAG: CoA ester lyase [Gemmatimonadetes bacterium]|jgi:citrate lyase subunit beta/citryl-CoA lyase|nr:CoA ester lyase [Gemmatimonadota bacterium]
MFDPDICRSLLFVPAGNERYLRSALRGTADVIQIDLEDAIAPAQKERARNSARSFVAQIAAAGRVAAVRVNSEEPLLGEDLDAVVLPGLAALTIPKVDTGAMLAQIDAAITQLETARGLAPGGIRLIAQIESARGVLNAREIAGATPRLAALGLGMEDLIADVGGAVGADALYFPAMQTLYAAREAAVTPIGYLGSITVYRDTDRFGEWIRRAKSLGFEGGFCIHPNQIEILNREFRPSPAEVRAAEALVAAYQQQASTGVGAFAHEGKLVDAPVIARAQRVLRRAAVLP